MKLLYLFAALLLFSIQTDAQKVTYVYRNYDDSTFDAYLKIIPKNQPIKGLVIRDYSRLPNWKKKSPYKLTDMLVEKGILVLYTCTSNYFPELGYTDKPLRLLDEIVNEVIVAHAIPKNNIFIGGISASGTRALQFTKYCIQGKSKYGTKIKAVFAVDSPLDFERFYYSVHNNGKGFKAGMLEEAILMKRVFKEKMGSPTQNRKKFLARSIYSQFAKEGGNAVYFKNTPIIIFHEPDMYWWKQERNASYYDINSFDIIGFVNQLKTLGNKDVSLITTSNKGYQNGIRKCHSWSIVDEPFLLSWILSRTD